MVLCSTVVNEGLARGPGAVAVYFIEGSSNPNSCHYKVSATLANQLQCPTTIQTYGIGFYIRPN